MCQIAMDSQRQHIAANPGVSAAMQFQGAAAEIRAAAAVASATDCLASRLAASSLRVTTARGSKTLLRHNVLYRLLTDSSPSLVLLLLLLLLLLFSTEEKCSRCVFSTTVLPYLLRLEAANCCGCCAYTASRALVQPETQSGEAAPEAAATGAAAPEMKTAENESLPAVLKTERQQLPAEQQHKHPQQQQQQDKLRGFAAAETCRGTEVPQESKQERNKKVRTQLRSAAADSPHAASSSSSSTKSRATAAPAARHSSFFHKIREGLLNTIRRLRQLRQRLQPDRDSSRPQEPEQHQQQQQQQQQQHGWKQGPSTQLRRCRSAGFCMREEEAANSAADAAAVTAWSDLEPSLTYRELLASLPSLRGRQSRRRRRRSSSSRGSSSSCTIRETIRLAEGTVLQQKAAETPAPSSKPLKKVPTVLRSFIRRCSPRAAAAAGASTTLAATAPAAVAVASAIALPVTPRNSKQSSISNSSNSSASRPGVQADSVSTWKWRIRSESGGSLQQQLRLISSSSSNSRRDVWTLAQLPNDPGQDRGALRAVNHPGIAFLMLCGPLLLLLCMLFSLAVSL